MTRVVRPCGHFVLSPLRVVVFDRCEWNIVCTRGAIVSAPHTSATGAPVSLKPLPVFAKGFRPFFILGATYAALSVPLWLLTLAGHLNPGAYLGGMFWHAHEMVFGFLVAIFAGFLLTAIGNWTRLPTADAGLLATLCALWVLGRIGIIAADALPPLVPAALDLAFLPALVVVCAIPIVRARNYRNYLFIGVLLAFLASGILVHLGALGIAPGFQRLGSILGVDVATVGMIAIGSRVVPMFTRNATSKQGLRSIPVLDKAAIIGALAIVVLDALPWTAKLATYVAGATGLVVLLRMRYWGAQHTLRQPLLWILHAGQFWIGLGLLLRVLAALTPWVTSSSSLHAITVGGAGCLTLGMMTRVGLGHTGRAFNIPKRMAAAFFAMLLAGVLRVVGPSLAPGALEPLIAAGLLWSLSFAIYLVTYTPVLLRPRVDGRPG